jgi:mRNA degradation ribonuclease J1/J2
MSEVAEGIHRLTNGISNFYLIQESGKLVLVDAGAPKDWDLLGRTVAELGRDLADLDAVLLTHAHTDHIGFAEQARATTGARVWVHEHDAQMARTGKVGPCTWNAYTGRTGPQIMPSGLNADTPRAVASLANLDGIRAGLLLPGHGEPWTGGVQDAIQRARTAGPS